MKTTLLFLLAGILGLSACEKEASVAPNEDITALQEKFHGKYKPVYSTSSLALDVNRDGVASTDMLAEISDLSQTWVEVRIYEKNQHSPAPSFLFLHQWPKQELLPVEPTTNNPFIRLSYATKVVVWPFSLDKSLAQLLLEPNKSYLADPDVFSPLETVLVKENEQIEVTLTKRLYTTEGWKTVKIVTLYKRFTRFT